MTQKARIGIIGCGNISTIYLTNCARFANIEVVALADLVRDQAEKQAQAFGIKRVLSVEELLNDEGVDIVLNLTIPAAHGEIALNALRYGKSVYNEKPLALERQVAADRLRPRYILGGRLANLPQAY